MGSLRASSPFSSGPRAKRSTEHQVLRSGKCSDLRYHLPRCSGIPAPLTVVVMHTEVTFINRSLNPNVTFVGVYWDRPGVDHEDVRRFWFLIERCRYNWCRSFVVIKTKSTAAAIAQYTLTRDPNGRRIRNYVLDASFERRARFAGPDRLRLAADPCRRTSRHGFVFYREYRSDQVDVHGLATVSITMTGGQPGPECRPIGFVPHDARGI